MAYSTYWCEEMLGSPTESGSNDKGGSFQASVQLKCLWEERYKLLEDIIGGMRLYPRLEKSGARATSGSCKPFSGCVRRITKKDAEGSKFDDWGFASYEFAEVDIKYQVQAETKDLISESLTPTLEITTLDYRRFRWATNTNAAYVPDAEFQRMLAALRQGFDAITWTGKIKIVADSVAAALMNATMKHPWTMRENDSRIKPVKGTGTGPSQKRLVDYLQPMYAALAGAVNPDFLPKKDPKVDTPVSPAPSLEEIIHGSKLFSSVKASPNPTTIVTRGMPDENTPENVKGDPARLKALMYDLLNKATPRYYKLGSPINENEAPGRRMMGMEYGLTFYRVKSIPAWVSNYLGCVNNATVQAKLLGISFTEGTLLFDTPTISRKWNFIDEPYWQVDYKLKFRPQGWNTFWRSDINTTVKSAKGIQYLTAGAFDTMQVNLGTPMAPTWVPYMQYPFADFSQIWGMSGGGNIKLPPGLTDANRPGGQTKWL